MRGAACAHTWFAATGAPPGSRLWPLKSAWCCCEQGPCPVQRRVIATLRANLLRGGTRARVRRRDALLDRCVEVDLVPDEFGESQGEFEPVERNALRVFLHGELKLLLDLLELRLQFGCGR